MNPRAWPREYQIALLIAALIGAVVGVVVGYIAEAAGSGAEGSVSFVYWLKRPLRFGGIWWGLMGAAVGVGTIYIRRLTSK